MTRDVQTLLIMLALVERWFARGLVQLVAGVRAGTPTPAAANRHALEHSLPARLELGATPWELFA